MCPHHYLKCLSHRHLWWLLHFFLPLACMHMDVHVESYHHTQRCEQLFLQKRSHEQLLNGCMHQPTSSILTHFLYIQNNAAEETKRQLSLAQLGIHSSIIFKDKYLDEMCSRYYPKCLSYRHPWWLLGSFSLPRSCTWTYNGGMELSLHETLWSHARLSMQYQCVNR